MDWGLVLRCDLGMSTRKRDRDCHLRRCGLGFGLGFRLWFGFRFGFRLWFGFRFGFRLWFGLGGQQGLGKCLESGHHRIEEGWMRCWFGQCLLQPSMAFQQAVRSTIRPCRREQFQQIIGSVSGGASKCPAHRMWTLAPHR